MNQLVQVVLLALLCPLLGAPTEVDSQLKAVNIFRAGGRRLADNKPSLAEQIEEQKKKIQKEKDALEEVDKDIKKVHHEVKELEGRRGKQSRLDKLEEENQLKLCWWPEDFVYVIINGDLREFFGGSDGPGIPVAFGIHFQVPDNMKAFKFTDLPDPTVYPNLYLNIDSDSNGDIPAPHYVVAKLKGAFTKYPNAHFFFPDNILYFGRNPPSEIPVEHKDHLYVQAVFVDREDTRALFDSISGVSDSLRVHLALTTCAEMSERVGSTVGFAVLIAFEPEIRFGYVFTLGEYSLRRTAAEFGEGGLDVGFPGFGPLGASNVPSICPLVPLQASRCF